METETAYDKLLKKYPKRFYNKSLDKSFKDGFNLGCTLVKINIVDKTFNTTVIISAIAMLIVIGILLEHNFHLIQ